jgi:hypothetical protein
VCADGLTAARRVVGGRYPVALQSWIQSGTWRDMTEPTAAFLHQHRQVDHLLSDLRALPTLGSRVTLLWQHLFPRPDYMLTRGGAGSRLMLPYLYLRRILKGVPRWFTDPNSNSDSHSDY